MRKLVAIAAALLTLTACSKPRTEAPMERRAAPERPAREKPPEPTPAVSDFSYAVLEHSTPREMFADSVISVVVKIRNTSGRTWRKGGDIKLGFYWLDPKGNKLAGLVGRGLIRRDTPPDAGVSVGCKVQAPPRLGLYRLVFDLVEEKVAWFGERGATPLTVTIAVR